MRTFQRIAWPRRTRGPAAGALLALLSLVAAPTRAGDWTPFGARTGLELAREAALAWAPDAALVYVENDEDVDDSGAAVRWSYLFLSPSQQKLRSYSIRAGTIVVAENLNLKFEAPAVDADWIDSGAALHAADLSVGIDFRSKEGGQLSNMLLMRGAFQDKNPDETTWTVVYTAPNAPSLYVVVDASAGKVRRTWRG